MLDFDLFQTNEDTPALITSMVTILLSFFLSSMIAITYKFTNSSFEKRNHLLQTLVLISMVASAIMLAIGDSLAVGLGMLGALSIIRFRTAVSDPRNITFIFASLGIGISCGVLAFNVAIIGTLFFCLIAIFFRYTPWEAKNKISGNLHVRYQTKQFSSGKIQKLIIPYTSTNSIIEINTFRKTRNQKNKKVFRNEEVVLFIEISTIEHLQELLLKLKSTPGIVQYKFINNVNIGKL
ncbi:DUF4956 domain-containing protein [Aquimarina sp. ERC-38]|uniref:DUF4956 domain-containing protein n=1 Tax=Aquimarina sp. ERC-38 TaxID=2949996 RepID=UPI0022462D5C|nr:DUF4956 domain-containing protein [Aquimarina sp. ERC-38]UZO80564.1 DUF4956 domain-containing protein [Aquimarina sp. ERC-38]